MWGDELMFQMDLEEDKSAKKGDEVEDALATEEGPVEGQGQATADATVPESRTVSAAATTVPVGRTVSAAAEMPARARDDMKPTCTVGLSKSQPVYIPSMESTTPEEPKPAQQQASSFMPGPPPGTKQRYRYGY